jgi:trehalose 6-phosphate synthase/phosphatase
MARYDRYKLFAEKVAEIYQPGDLIIVHDYHLLLAPKMIRDALSTNATHNGTGGEEEAGKLQKLGEKIGNAASNIGQSLGMKSDKVNEIMIGMFMHTPWPSSEIFRCLPSTSLSCLSLCGQY